MKNGRVDQIICDSSTFRRCKEFLISIQQTHKIDGVSQKTSLKFVRRFPTQT